MKNLFKFYALIAFLLVSSAGNSNAQAEVCAGGYPRSDRPVIVYYESNISSVLWVLRHFAEYTAGTQMSDEEIQANRDIYRLYLQDFNYSTGNYHEGGLTQRGQDFLRDVVNYNYLGIYDLYPDDIRPSELQAHARDTLNSLNLAEIKLRLCLRGSWDRLILNPPPSETCRKGYDYSDFTKVLTQFVKGIRIIENIYLLAKDSASGLYSITQRRVLGFDFEYLTEELYLLGESHVSGISSKSREFLKIIFNPQFLNISDLKIAGNTEIESIALGRTAMNRVDQAVVKSTSCMQSGKPLIRKK